MGKKTTEQKNMIDDLNKFYLSREEVINIFLKIMQKWSSMHARKQNKIKLKEQDLKYKHLNKCFKDCQ